MSMGIPESKLEQIQNLINAKYNQDAALLLRQILQKEPENYMAWLLLSQVTTGNAQELCLSKAAAFRKTPDLGSTQNVTVPYVPGMHAALLSPAPLRQPNPNSASKATASQKTKQTTTSQISFSRWVTIGFSGLLLGCIGIFLLTRFSPNIAGTNPASAQSHTSAQMATAIVETAVPIAALEESDDNTSQGITVVTLTPTAEPEIVATATPAPTEQQLAAKPINENGEMREAWTPTPTPTPTSTTTPTIEPTRLSDLTSFVLPNVGDEERWVDVNLTLQTLTAYEGQSPVMQTLISSGRPPYYTVTGQFRVYYRLEEQTMDGRRLGFDYVTPGVPFVQYFYGDFAIHGATWHNDFGTPVSHGCVNVTPTDAEWLYNWMSYGTLVSVHY